MACGRRYFDGTGGNNHAIEHNHKTQHPVSVKIGTLNSDANPSAYCYKCDDEVKVYKIKEILSKFNIDIEKLVKTEKTINELSLEYNLNLKLSHVFEETEQLE